MSLQTAKTLATLLDSQFNVFGIKFGLDPIIDIIPGAGDILGALLSIYIIKVGVDERLPQEKIIQMVGNVIIDFLLGAIPGVGVVADVFYKSNLKNIAIIESHIGRKMVAEEGEIV